MIVGLECDGLVWTCGPSPFLIGQQLVIVAVNGEHGVGVGIFGHAPPVRRRSPRLLRQGEVESARRRWIPLESVHPSVSRETLGRLTVVLCLTMSWG
jgi:uncharacterized protein YcgI (DUF1989 family)